MLGCLFSLFMKLSRTFFVNVKFHSAYKSVIGDFHKKKIKTNEPAVTLQLLLKVTLHLELKKKLL